MKKMLLVPALLLAACADDPTPGVDQPIAGAVEGTVSETAEPNDNALSVSFVASPAACDRAEVSFEGVYAYADGTSVSNPICRYDFGDGTYADSCAALHSYVTGPGNYLTSANVTLTVTDPATGATASFTDLVLPPGNFDASLRASSDGLTISWEAHAYYVDGEVGIDSISIEPADKVIIDDPSVLSRGTGTVRVTEPGTYVVKSHSGIYPGVENCEVDLEQTVEVTACSTVH